MPARPEMAAASWALDGGVARRNDAWIDLAAPRAGLAVTGGGRLLGLDLRTTPGGDHLADHWVRGDDLVAVYEPADPRRLRATAMWRPLAGHQPAYELVVSAQTALVESDSALAVTCDLAAGRVSCGTLATGPTPRPVAWRPLPAAAPCPPDASCLLVTTEAGAVLVAVHPADARRITSHLDGDRLRIDCWLFSTAIEKGVLLRSRVLAATGPAGDTAWADALVRAFAASPAPLTA